MQRSQARHAAQPIKCKGHSVYVNTCMQGITAGGQHACTGWLTYSLSLDTGTVGGYASYLTWLVYFQMTPELPEEMASRVHCTVCMDL